MSYHNNNKYEFTQYLASDGTCTAAPAPSPVDTNCVQDLGDGGTITVYYDPDTELVVMEASIPDGSYGAWGWGASMTETEIVMFSGNGASSDVQYFYSTTETAPGAE